MPQISSDGSTLYFSSDRPGGLGGNWGDIYQAPIIPIVDLNANGIIDAADMCIVVDYWGTDEPLCDIGPMPWGDGIIDIEDLKVLAEHIDKNVDDPTLIAHWAMDETEGAIAQDTGGTCDGALIGTPLWHPGDGKIDGALELDGSTFVATGHVVSPADGSFSVLAWIKTDVPGPVIVSQDQGSDWLGIDAESGGLMTAVAPPSSRFPAEPVVSEVPITDGFWHRIALVWDGASRSLYVDGTLVAADEQKSLVPCTGGLNIGCGADQSPGTFFSGLVDDVRIYNRAVTP